MIELRTYTLATADALRQYTVNFWPRHIQSLRKHAITVHGVWIDTSSEAHRVVALVGYPPADDPARLVETYRDSNDFAADHADFDVSLIISTDTATLEPISSSPLQY